MTIQAVRTASSTCPIWCAADIPSHISAEQVVVATSGPERTEVYVGLEQALGEPVAIRVQGAGDTPMTPAQALQLAAVLTTQAFSAATSWSVTR